MITIKTPAEVNLMQEGGRRLAALMVELSRKIRTGISTGELDYQAEKMILACGGSPSFKKYRDSCGRRFPAAICASLNEEVVHAVPSSERKLKKGDLLKIDIGMEYRGWHTDMARTFPVGEVSSLAQKLILVTEASFWAGFKTLSEGEKLSNYSKAVQRYVEKKGFSVVRELVGHGIGRFLHEDPQIPNYYKKENPDYTLKAGMTLALEPMVNAGKAEVALNRGKWAFVTKDGSLSAHYENTVLITKTGAEVLTLPSSHPEFDKKLNTRYLGIDYGRTDVGLALAEEPVKVASRYKTLKNDRDFLQTLSRIIEEQKITTVIIGIPSYINREDVEYEGERLGRWLEKNLGVRVFYQNEMFTTKMAQENLKAHQVKKIKLFDDQEAARIILQEWLENN